jgi:DoxX-like family
MKKQIVGNILIALGGILLFGSAAAKLSHVPKVVMQMAAMGFGGNKLLFIALLEIASAVLFLIPLTRSFGLLLVCSYLGGAIATHLQHDQSIVPPSIVLALIWLGVWLRHREVRWSFGALKESSIRAVDAAMLHKQSVARS